MTRGTFGTWLSTLSEQLTREMKLAWRRIRAAPGPTVFAILTLALGIGVTVATYSVVYTALWRPLGIAHEKNVMLLSVLNSLKPHSAALTWTDYQDFLHEQQGFAGVAAWTSRFNSVLAGLGTAELVEAEAVTGSYFDMLGVPATLGRVIASADDEPGRANVVVLSYATWRNQFRSDAAIVGQTVRIGDRAFQIVGVTPRGFGGVHPSGLVSLWIPLATAGQMGESLAQALRPGSQSAMFTVGVRLGPGQTPASAAKAVNDASLRLDARAPLAPAGEPAKGKFYRYWTAGPISDDQTVNERDEMGRLIVGLPALVLLIACSNLANLVLSRGAARRHDFGVRRALGASRWRLIREQLVEQIAIVLCGGVAGVTVAYWLVRAASSIAQANLAPFLRGFQFDWGLDASVLVSTGVAVLLSIVVAGLIPALHLTRDSLRAVLDSGSNAATPRWRGRANLVALQVGISVGLFLVAVIFVRMMLDDSVFRRNVFVVTPGSERVAVALIPFRMQHRDADRAASIVDRTLQALHDAPDIVAAAATSDQPYGRIGIGGYYQTAVTTPDRPFAEGKDPGGIDVPMTVVSAGLFAVLDRPIQLGRTFNDADRADGPPVAIVNEGLALDLFGTANAVGRQMLVWVLDRSIRAPAQQRLVTVVGVAPGAVIVHDFVPGAPKGVVRHRAALYVPFAQQPLLEVALLARGTDGRPAPMQTLRAAIHQADPELAVSLVSSGNVLEGGPFAFLGYCASVVMSLALLALGLAMAGLYGVLSHIVARRTREMGIRIAIGATSGRIVTMVFRDGFRPIVEGLFIGLATATVFRVFLKTAMSAKEIAPVDPLACLAATVLVGVAGGLACYLPARRAASVDPNVALRVQ